MIQPRLTNSDSNVSRCIHPAYSSLEVTQPKLPNSDANVSRCLHPAYSSLEVIQPKLPNSDSKVSRCLHSFPVLACAWKYRFSWWRVEDRLCQLLNGPQLLTRHIGQWIIFHCYSGTHSIPLLYSTVTVESTHVTQFVKVSSFIRWSVFRILCPITSALVRISWDQDIQFTHCTFNPSKTYFHYAIYSH